MEVANKNIYIEYTFSDDEGSHKTGVAAGKKFDPKFGEEHKFEVQVSENMLRYLQKDAIRFQVSFGTSPTNLQHTHQHKGSPTTNINVPSLRLSHLAPTPLISSTVSPRAWPGLRRVG